MIKGIFLSAAVSTLLFVGTAWAQHPLVDEAAAKVVAKYQRSTCEQLWVQKAEAKPPREQEAVEALRNNPDLRREFLDRVAAPIANKMFECGMLP